MRSGGPAAVNRTSGSGYFNDWPHYQPRRLPAPPDKNGNAFLLKNYECPECGNSRRLKISVYTHVTVTDEGIEDYGDPCEGDLDWDEHSNVECPSCGHRAELVEFDLTERIDGDDEE